MLVHGNQESEQTTIIFIAVGKYAGRPLVGLRGTIAGIYARQRFKPSCASET